MTKSEIVEALRCAADHIEIDRGPLGSACDRLGLSHLLVSDEARRVLGRGFNYRPNGKYHHDLLEAAQRIEEGE